MMPLFKRIFFILLLSACTSSSGPAKGFSLAAISSPLSHHREWEGRAPLSEEEEATECALAQNYHYLGSGGQSFAFLSDDGKYVIKFFKQKVFDLPAWSEHFPLPWLAEKQKKKKEKKRSKVFSAFKICYDKAAHETAILYLHLNPTSHLGKQLKFTGPDGSRHEIALDPIPFIVQKKAELAYASIDRLAAAGDLDGAKRAIDQLLNLHMQLCKRGMRNRDANFRSNCGFIDGEPVVIDVGRIVYSEAVDEEKEVKRIAPRFRKWLAHSHPDLLPHFEQSIAEIKRNSR